MSECSRRQFISKAGGVALASAGFGAACRALAPGASAQADTSEDGQRLNVLLLLTDDQGPHLGCLGTRGISTPAADTLAGQGVLFRRAYATCASCSPARSSILTGMYERTLILLTSDQGYCYHRAKATAYDMGIHVPLIVSGPGVRQGATTRRLASHVDLVATILDFLGLPIPATVQGRTLRPLLEEGDVSSWRDYVFAEHNAHGPNPLEYYPIRSVFDGRLHYLRNLAPERRWEGDPVSLLDAPQMPAQVGFAGPADAFPGGPWDNHSYEATVLARDEFPAQYELLAGIFKRPAEEVYDLHDDPYETDDVAADVRYTAHLERLRAALDDWIVQTDDPGVALRTIPRRTGDDSPRRRRG